MKRNNKTQMTVRLEADVFRAVKERERRTGMPRSVIVAEAAKQTLVPPPHESPEAKMTKTATRVLTRIEQLERAIGTELWQVKELIALLARAYFNHTPAIPDSQRDAASLSGRARFAHLTELLERNLNDGTSILGKGESNNGH